MSLVNPQPPLNVGVDAVPLDADETPTESKWIRIARQIYEDSTEYLDAFSQPKFFSIITSKVCLSH